jgi:uncharacterized membrane protein YgdD (TMEM256/DUF423 family)
MFNNIGTVDRLIRLILASTLFYFGLLVYSGSALGIALTVGAIVLTATALAGSCLLYGLLGINTRNPQQN